jgi:hypothetical protein
MCEYGTVSMNHATVVAGVPGRAPEVLAGLFRASRRMSTQNCNDTEITRIFVASRRVERGEEPAIRAQRLTCREPSAMTQLS